MSSLGPVSPYPGLSTFSPASASSATGVPQTTTAIIIEKAYGLPSPRIAPAGLFPGCLGEVKTVGRSLGGTYGVFKVTNEEGQAWVQKTYKSSKDDQTECEYSAHKVYKICGTPVPEVMKYHKVSGLIAGTSETPPELVVLAEFIDGEPIGRYLSRATADEQKAVCEKIQKNFVVDCLLGNYDIVGDSSSNILVTPASIPSRVDNGASFDFRATGSRKTVEGEGGFKKWGPTVPEIEDMRKDTPRTFFPEIQNARDVYRGLSDEEVIRQIDEVYTHKESILAAVPPRHREMMAARLENLQLQKETLKAKVS